MSHFYLHNGIKKPSPTTILGACIDKSGAMAQAAVNETVKYLKTNNFTEDIFQKVFDENPSAMEYETDARDVWPKRWEKVKEKFKQGFPLSTETDPGNWDNILKYHYAKEWKKQRDIGSKTHQIIGIYLSNQYLYKSHYPEVENTMRAFLQFAANYHLEPLHTEYRVYGNYCAGTTDFKGYITIKGKKYKYILDWKTNKKFYDRSHMLQGAKYRQLDGDTDIDGHGAVRLDKLTGEYEFKDGGGNIPRSRDTYISDLRKFNAYMVAYMENHPRIAKNCNWRLPNNIGKGEKILTFEQMIEGIK